MSQTKIIFAAASFIFEGILFLTAAFFLRRPERIKAVPLCKPAGFIFYIIGVVTEVYGILALVFKNELTRNAVQIFALVYLIFITIAFIFFYASIKVKK